MDPINRKLLIQKCIDADLLNISTDRRLLIGILMDGTKGYTNMSDTELAEAAGSCDLCGGDLDEEFTFCLNRNCPNNAAWEAK